MITAAAKRFYEQTGTVKQQNGFGVTLDSRPVKTPGGNELSLPTEAAAIAVAAEWDAQVDAIKPSSMPCMQLACTAIDRVSAERDNIVDQVAKYGGSDLICYLADTPDDLVRLQHATWQPLLDWALEAHDIKMISTNGITFVAQPDDTVAVVRNVVAEFDDFELTVVTELTFITGSVVIALALVAGRLDPDSAFEACQLDETYQIEHWGKDEEAEKRRKTILFDIKAAARFLDLIRS